MEIDENERFSERQTMLVAEALRKTDERTAMMKEASAGIFAATIDGLHLVAQLEAAHRALVNLRETTLRELRELHDRYLTLAANVEGADRLQLLNFIRRESESVAYNIRRVTEGHFANISAAQRRIRRDQ